MAIQGKKLSELTEKVENIQGTERIYVSDGSGVPKYINTNQFATKTEVTEGLAGKQDKGDYALKSEIPDISGLATKEELNNITPTVGENGNWYINGEDTGKPSKGADGVSLGEIALTQSTGDSQESVMSQKAVTDKFTELDNKFQTKDVDIQNNILKIIGERTINLLNYTNSEIGIVESDGKVNSNNATYSSSHFIEVKGSTKYVSNFTIYRAVEYDENFNVIGFVSGVNYTEFTTQANTKYVRISVTGVFAINNQVCEESLFDGKVYPYFQKLKEGITGELTNDDFKTISYNLFNPENREANKIPSEGINKFYKDTLSDNSNFWGIGLIPVENGKTYSFWYGTIKFGINYVFGYDSMMRNVGIIQKQNDEYQISDERIKYISGYLSNGYNYNSVMLIEGNIQPQSFVPYNPIPYFQSKELALKENIIDLRKDQIVTKKDVYGISLEYKNLITLYVNKWLDADKKGMSFSEAIEASDNTYGNINTNLIPVQKGTDVYLFFYSNPADSDNRQAIEIDSNGIILSITPFGSGTNKYTATSDKVSYIAVQWPKGYGLATLLYENQIKNNTAYFMQKRLAFYSDILLWEGKKVCIYGDSITEFGFWWSALSYYFGFSEVVNRGISASKITNIDPFQYWVNSVTGDKISSENVEEPDPTWENPLRIYSNFSNQDRINTVPIDCDLVIIMGGTNDTGATNPSNNTGDCNFDSETGTFKENTIMGAVCETIRKMQIRCPNAVIVFATPLSGLGSYSDNKNYAQSFKINEMAKVIKDACFYMSIPVIDVFGTCGINISNSAKYLKEDKVHPTYGNENNGYNGASMISRAMIGGLMSILPMFKGGQGFKEFV